MKTPALACSEGPHTIPKEDTAWRCIPCDKIVCKEHWTHHEASTEHKKKLRTEVTS